MRKKILLSAVAVCATATCTAPSVAAAQRAIEVEPPSTFRDPVLVSKVTVGGSEVQCKRPSPLGAEHLFEPITPFEWGDDWLQNIEIHLFNRTSRTIVFGRVVVAFSELGSGPAASGRRVAFLDFGRIPANAAFFGDGKPMPQNPDQQPLSWGPRQTIVVHVGDYIDKIRGQIHDEVPTQVFIIKRPFFFADGMRWDGDYAVPDPAHPGQWVAKEPLHFPGDREDNWPVPGQRWTPGPRK
ncbi:exported hypothetical protein [Candidatus Sulfopaludibacter sp. SbA4]|nr:exported hypothetical protein [Candidatus Sulfopaludibacter sp. SbA4]